MDSREVRALQEALNRKGADIAVDGILGPETAGAQAFYRDKRSRSWMIALLLGAFGVGGWALYQLGVLSGY